MSLKNQKVLRRERLKIYFKALNNNYTTKILPHHYEI